MKTQYRILKYLSITGVKFYRKFISPYKGFQCAHSHYTNSPSCSTYGLKQLQTNNDIIDAIRLIFQRLRACSHINNLYKESNHIQYHSKQSGFVDCGGCDAPDCGHCHIGGCDSHPLNACDVVENCCDCDIFNRNSSKPLKEDSKEKSNSLSIHGFEFIDQLENGWLLYYLPQNEHYYKIHESCIHCEEVDLLKGNTNPSTEMFNKEQIKDLFKKKKVKLTLEKI